MSSGKGASIEVIKTEKAGPPVGPYSQGIRAGGFIFVAGEKGMDPVTKPLDSFLDKKVKPCPILIISKNDLPRRMT